MVVGFRSKRNWSQRKRDALVGTATLVVLSAVLLSPSAALAAEAERPWQSPQAQATRPAAQAPRVVEPASRRTPIVSEAVPVRARFQLEREQRDDPCRIGVPPSSDTIRLPIESDFEAGEAQSDAPSSPAARARAAARLAAEERKLAIKIGGGVRFDSLSSVSDWNADKFSIFRFPVFIDVPAGLDTRVRFTGEPTVIDNGRINDGGVSGTVAIHDLVLGTHMLIASGGVGSTPAGFPRQPYLTGFAQVAIAPQEGLELTPFYQRQPVMESLLSFRGEELIDGDESTFIGKVIQDRFGGRVAFETETEVDGVIEAAYSSVQGIRIPSNEKYDAFLGIGRTFDLRSYDNQIRPGIEVAFFHYEKDLSEPLRAVASQAQSIRDAIRNRQTGGGYFSPDAFVQSLMRFDFSGPLFPEHVAGAAFVITGKVGATWISGVDSAHFQDAEGTHVVGGIESAMSLPIEDAAVLQLSGGSFWGEPYNRAFALVSAVFPLPF